MIQNQYYREGLRLPLFEKMNPPGKVRIRSFYESKGLVHVREWQKDYEFSRKYWYWYDYAIDQDGYIVYKKRNDESYNDSHKVNAKVLALLWYDTIIQVRSWVQMMFNSMVEQGVKLNDVEISNKTPLKPLYGLS
ncbi:hypothetical protein [Helicobacter suis]|uniref:hypothetical protein n=1 Tax=Helicobacter suis TaxID=104628 RepID=UPI0013D23025|nr:hypothetical protein [Helicobacter suis]